MSCQFFPSFSLPCLFAKHAQDKGAKWARSKRPKKTRKSDIIRAPTNYPAFEKPAEYTIIIVTVYLPCVPLKWNTVVV